jgi:hypothetical protein
MQRPEKGNVKNLPEIAGVEFVELRGLRNRRVGDHDIEPAEFGERSLDHATTRIGTRDIGMMWDRTTASSLDLGRHLERGRVLFALAGTAPIVDDDRCPARAEGERVGAPKPFAGPGDDRDPAGKIRHREASGVRPGLAAKRQGKNCGTRRA